MGRREINQIIEHVSELSTLPEVTQKILSLTEDPSSSARDLNEVLKHDIALSAKLLRVVNSAFYGLPGRVADLDRAIVLLGFQAVRNLAVAATMATLFRTTSCCQNIYNSIVVIIKAGIYLVNPATISILVRKIGPDEFTGFT